ncbi:hypothetical protein CAK95_18800 [Pseudorhodoplanes sinuspersici]|uniref:SnoaL-like domain-containing protein n=2 Tax=Pseudorhodoplanes sinuspersici TaxID=1235591 RepID=A0A1W6ZUA4_9HYPH|nr:hypothetical protein CAK95_18800 [Pseudorhodoplanes sinuspersici]
MNQAFARAFNSRNIDSLLALYEHDAKLRVDASEKTLSGRSEIADELNALMQMPGTMISNNNFCIEHGDIALLRADWTFIGSDGTVVVSGSSAEIVRRQSDGTWRYAIDHAAGAGLARVA